MIYIVSAYYCESESSDAFKIKADDNLQAYAKIFKECFDEGSEFDDGLDDLDIGDRSYNLNNDNDLERYLDRVAKRYNNGRSVNEAWFKWVFETSETDTCDWSWHIRIVSIICNNEIIFS